MVNRPRMRCELIFTSLEQKKNYSCSNRKVLIGKIEIEENMSNLDDTLGL